MKSGKLLLLLGCSFALLLFSYCSKKSHNEPTTGILQGVITDAVTTSPLQDVSVIIFNADNNSPAGVTLKTDASGKYSAELVAGNYFIKLSRQGYEANPPKTLEAVPFAVLVSQTTQKDGEMFPSAIQNAGWIEGKVLEGSTGVKGALVVATDGANQVAFSTSSSENGDYSIFNVPAGSYTVRAYISSFNSSSPSANVTSNTATKNVNVAVDKSGNATLTGSIRNLSITNADVDISLVHPITKEAVPGLSTTSINLGSSYSIAHIPDGIYIARATYKNDNRVMDPDRIAKFGEPVVSVLEGVISPATLTFDVTGSVNLSAPTNAMTTTVPYEISSTKPTFQWPAYPSTSDYVIEVTDASTGAVVWGGFDKSGNLPVKNIVIPGSSTSIAYNSDGKATISQLVPGKVYRWRIYASKNDQNSTTGWTLISASEDQQGLIKIAN